jgi:hypothetical protein
MKIKSYRFFKKDLKNILLALRLAKQYEIEWIGAYAHMKDQSETFQSKENIKKFVKLGRKIQNFLQGIENDK